MSELRIIGGAEIRRLLDYETCIPLIREAMIALSRGETRQLPRGIVDLEQGRAFGAMTGALGRQAAFGAKIVSVFPDNFAKNRPSHQGVFLLFDPESGAPAALCEAGAVTAIRTAAASAVATDALARPDATRLAILGYGEQAREHIAAIARVRRLSAVTVWGRSLERAEAFAAEMAAAHGLSVTAAPSAEAAVADADIICTVTAASEPILDGRWVAAGTHVNLVGSSRAGPAEVDGELVARARFFADHAENVRGQGAEYLAALADGLIGPDHLIGEIGEVLDGRLPGRRAADEVTVYKSLGHIVQDLKAGEFLLNSAVGTPITLE